MQDMTPELAPQSDEEKKKTEFMANYRPGVEGPADGTHRPEQPKPKKPEGQTFTNLGSQE